MHTSLMDREVASRCDVRYVVYMLGKPCRGKSDVCAPMVMGARGAWEGTPHSLLNKPFRYGGAVLRRCILNADTATSFGRSSTLTVRHIVHELDQHYSSSAPASLSLPWPPSLSRAVHPVALKKAPVGVSSVFHQKGPGRTFSSEHSLTFLAVSYFTSKRSFPFPSPKYIKAHLQLWLNLQLRHGFSGKPQSHIHSNASLPSILPSATSSNPITIITTTPRIFRTLPSLPTCRSSPLLSLMSSRPPSLPALAPTIPPNSMPIIPPVMPTGGVTATRPFARPPTHRPTRFPPPQVNPRSRR